MAVLFVERVADWQPMAETDREGKAMFQGACLLAAYADMVRLFDLWDSLKAIQGFTEWLGSRIEEVGWRLTGIPPAKSAWSRWHEYLHIGNGEARPELRAAFDQCLAQDLANSEVQKK